MQPDRSDLPLDGVRVLDFSSLLPGPLATLLMAEAGAQVLQLERPPRGDEMRSPTPQLGAHGLQALVCGDPRPGSHVRDGRPGRELPSDLAAGRRRAAALR